LLRHGSKQAILTVFIISNALFLSGAYAQTVSVIPANLAAAHIGEYATVEGVVAKVFTSKNGNTFLNMGASYPNQTFTGWIPNSSPVKDSAVLDGIEGKHVKITGRIEMYKGKPEIRRVDYSPGAAFVFTPNVSVFVQIELSSTSMTYLAPLAAPSTSGNMFSYRIPSDHSFAKVLCLITPGKMYRVKFSSGRNLWEKSPEFPGLGFG
jgi:hypothetical protein